MGVEYGGGFSTAMNIFSILTLPMSPQELDRDMSAINRHVQNLVPKLFLDYDKIKPPYPEVGGPVQVLSYMLINHIEQLNEFDQTLTFHGTILLNWLDYRLSWDPEDFGHLDKLSFNGFDLSRLWWPGVTIKGITMPARQIAMFHNTAYTSCFVMLFTPFYPSSRVTFTASSMILAQHSLFSEHNMTMASGFELDRVETQRFFAYGKGFTLNESEAELYSSLTNTVLHYKICLRRKDNGIYTATIALPIFGTVFIAFLAVFMPSIRLSLFWLICCIWLLEVHNYRMTQVLPRDFDSEPFCIRISRFLLVELLLLLFYRLWFSYQLDRIQKQQGGEAEVPKPDGQSILPQFLSRASPESLNTLKRVQNWMKWILAAETMLLAYWFFY